MPPITGPALHDALPACSPGSRRPAASRGLRGRDLRLEAGEPAAARYAMRRRFRAGNRGPSDAAGRFRVAVGAGLSDPPFLRTGRFGGGDGGGGLGEEFAATWSAMLASGLRSPIRGFGLA